MFLCNEKVWPLAKQLEILSFSSQAPLTQLLIEKVRKVFSNETTKLTIVHYHGNMMLKNYIFVHAGSRCEFITMVTRCSRTTCSYIQGPDVNSKF